MFSYLLQNKLISENQSGFKSGDSILALITTQITAAFIDISKVFDKLWHEGIIQELKPKGIQVTWENFQETS